MVENQPPAELMDKVSRLKKELKVAAEKKGPTPEAT